MLRIISFILLCAMQINSYALTPAAELIQLLSTTQTFQADFTQTIYNKKSKQTDQSTGHMVLQRPGKFLWRVKKPIAQLIIANNTRLWVYDPDLEQVTIRFLDKEIENTPVLLLSNPSLAIEKNFNVQTIQSAASLQWFALFPKNRDSMLAFIKMGFSKGQIQEIDLEDHLGHHTHIEFYNILMNKQVAASLFTFTPPANTDVIDETRTR